MKECYGKHFIKNGALLPVDDFDNSMVYEGETIYEVLRVIKGVPLFFNDHYERLVTSLLNRRRTNLATFRSLLGSIKTLAGAGQQDEEVNLKIVFNYNHSESHSLVYFVKASYPSAQQYRDGVAGILFRAERTDPASKVVNHELRASIEAGLAATKAYEALLVNSKNLITEGSRSNIFFIKGGILFTAPDNLVLGGITRRRLLDICRANGTDVRYECVNTGTIYSYDSVLMSGTSPILLPFKSVDKNMFAVDNPLIEKLREMFMEKARQSIDSFIAEKFI
ncbi:MAG: aminotransferase class IV [Bacteroidales bacterium]|jgi:branched-chain amino acid aminotransferase|nr:aminotransferase class IV [Bacteroidales bacterium]